MPLLHIQFPVTVPVPRITPPASSTPLKVTFVAIVVVPVRVSAPVVASNVPPAATAFGKAIVPLAARTVPVFTKFCVANVNAPAPAVFCTVPALVKMMFPPLPPNWIAASARKSSTPVARLLKAGLVVALSAPPVVHASVPELFSVRLESTIVPPIVPLPPLASVVSPAPLSVPPVQFRAACTVSVAEPVSVPPVWVKVPTVVFVARVIVELMFRIAVSTTVGTPLSRSQFSGLNQSLLPDELSHT